MRLKRKNVENVSIPIEEDPQEGTSGVHASNHEEKEQLHSPTTNTKSSSSSPSSTPIRLRRLSDIYETCNFYVVEPECFEQTVREEVWRNAMEDEIKMIEKNETWELLENQKRRMQSS